jgi:hypothetical protein
LTSVVAGNSGSSRPQILIAQISNPLGHYGMNVLAYRKEPGSEALGELGIPLPGVLHHVFRREVDVLELQRSKGWASDEKAEKPSDAFRLIV